MSTKAEPVPTARLLERVETLRAMTVGRTRPEDTAVRCLDCLDTGWETAGTLAAPCRQCNPVVYRRWREGHYRGDHGPGCEECSMVSRGELKVGRDVDPVTGHVRPGVLADP